MVTKRETKSQERKPPKSTSVFYMTPAGASTPLVEERARPVHKRTPRQEDVSNSGAKNAERAIKSKSLEINAASKELDHSGAYKDFKLVVSTSELQMPPPKNQITKKDHTDSKHPSSHRQGTPSMGKMQARSLNALDNQSPGTHRKSSTRQPKGYSQDTNHNQLKPKGEPVNVSGSASTTTAESWKYSSADPIVMSSQDSHKRTGPRGSLENVISAIRKPLTPQLEKKRKEQDHGGKDEIPNFAEKFDSLKDITCLNDIDDLRTKQMKAILKKHGVDVRTLSTDQELRYAVIRLWSYKKEKGGSVFCTNVSNYSRVHS